jgi:hypothetical protein
MDDWQKNVSEMLETLADQVEDFFLDVAHDMTEVVNIFTEFSEEIATQFHNAFADEMEQYVTELVGPVLEAYFGLGGAVEEATQPIVQTVEPLLKQHPVCVGCRHFHGQAYGGTLLVCGMHPYGVSKGEETCPDKEATIWKSPGFNEGQFFFGVHDEDW